jgi:peptide-methionine (S)-S-oxide reductase
VDKDKSERNSEGFEVATIGGGCFWCTEAVFNELEGVLKAEPGYSGGWVANPTYEEVCTGKTGHAEVVQITFDPNIISFGEILEAFLYTHDPTTLNRQGGDVGTQYRSVIFYHNHNQKVTAEKLIRQLSIEHKWEKPIVTKVEPFKAFFKAEEYHKNYFKRNPKQPYCRLIIEPKMEKLRKRYLDKLKKWTY